jgi:DNA-binding response OmpR family regulator
MTDRSLLIIDDEPAIGTLIGRAAQATGYRFVATSDPEVFKRNVDDTHPDIICLDLGMPGVDGIELLHFLAARSCTSQLLIISGFDGRMLAAALALAEGLGLNVVGTLSKPIHMAGLRDLLTELSRAAA